MHDRRTVLRGLGLASIPLIGGGLTLIGKAIAAPVPLVDVAAAPIFGDPRERARYAWEAFSSAMREISADAHGWHVQGGERLSFRDLREGAWLSVNSIHYEGDPAPRRPGLVVERFRKVQLATAMGGDA